MVRTAKDIDSRLYTILYKISDPEIPALSIIDLGIVQKVTLEGKHVEIDITPTYTGCPAMDSISMEIRYTLEQYGYSCLVNLVLDPAWTTDFISDVGLQKLKDYGVAPPLSTEKDKRVLYDGERLVPCPRCNSTNSKMISQFGSTACKSLFQCEDCMEPFDYFKCHK